MLRIAVFAGGPGYEREVSLRSGMAVCRALVSRAHRARLFDVVDYSLPEGFVAADWDLVFPALHGEFGEDGRLQALLEAGGVAYVGSGPLASQIAMNKLVAKRVMLRALVNTPAFELVPRATIDDRRHVERQVRALGLPLVVKPVQGGSSLGVSLVREIDQLEQALHTVARLGDDALLEDFIPGRELTVAILDDRALGIIETESPGHLLFDYEAKYSKGHTSYRVDPGDLGGEVRAKILHLALRAHRALGCRHLSRVDLRLSPWGDVYVLEVNTLPGMTDTSLFPKIAAQRGLAFPVLCDRLCRGALPLLRRVG